MNANWYDIDGFDELDSPALLLYKGRVLRNIALAMMMVSAATSLRPHVKTHKSLEGLSFEEFVG